MSKVRLLRSGALEELRGNIYQNLATYRGGDFGDIHTDPAFWFEYDLEVDERGLNALRAPADGKYFEVENCEILYATLEGLNPYLARDERLWVYLSHTALLEHGRLRWPIPTDDEAAARHIAKHFFARDKRQVERDNVGSRLWWMAHLCARVNSLEHRKALQTFLYRSDVRANLVERPTTSQCTELFNAIVRKLSASLDGKKLLFERKIFRAFMKEINSVGGYKLLDCLSSSHIETIIDDIVDNRLKLDNV
jgi:hypothetical protein